MGGSINIWFMMVNIWLMMMVNIWVMDFHKWRYPPNGWVFNGKSHLEMDDDWRYWEA